MSKYSNFIEQVIENYRKEHRAPIGLFHYHQKNTDFKNHITLLETAQEMIHRKKSPFKENLATFGILIIFRTLLIDPNRRNEVYNELINKLKLDDIINQLLAEDKPGVQLYYPDPKFLKYAKEGMEYALTHLIEAKPMLEELPPSFLKDLDSVMNAEFEYLNEVMNTLKFSRT